MKVRTLGRSGPTVSALGLGCMGMSEFYGPADEKEAVSTIRQALELGVTMFDTGASYGLGENERLLGRTLGSRRGDVVVATKFSGIRDESGNWRIEGRPEFVKSFCDESLQRLGSDYLDIFYMGRRNPEIPIEDTVGAMADLKAEGKIRYIGLCEVNARTLRAGHAVHPITALQSEYSLWTRGIEQEILPAARDLGVGIVPYSPLGHGFLTGTVRSAAELTDNDLRKTLPRFSEENLSRNVELLAGLQAVATEVNVTPAQIALAWLLAQGDDIVPIPGTKRVRYLRENVAAAEIGLSDEQLRRLDDAMSPEKIAGERYPEYGMATVEN